jgi:hypothetical protein
MSDAPVPKPAAGWYPDPWTPARRRYWNGSSWTFVTTDQAAFGDPAPADAAPLPPGHGLPDPVTRQPAPTEGGAAAPAKPKQNPVKWIAAVVVGLLVGIVGVVLSTSSSDDSASPPPSTAAGAPSPTEPFPRNPVSPPTSSPSSAAGNDPSAAALESLVVQPEDVPADARVVVFPGGIGLNQPTLDLCHATYPSETRRTARIQDAVLDGQGILALSTEAVLYGDSAATTQAFTELRSVATECPSTPVQGPTGESTTTTFNAAPDSSWPQTPTVNRVAYDVTITEPATPPRRLVAVYLQRGRALLGVYFSQPEGVQVPVEGKTTIPEIVGVFAGRLAALPTSVVGS